MTRKRIQKRVSGIGSRKISKKRQLSLQAQKMNDLDYSGLFEDYKKYAIELWNLPITKYVFGGVTVATILPLTVRLFRRYPRIKEFISEKVNAVEEKVEGTGTLIREKINQISDVDVEVNEERMY